MNDDKRKFWENATPEVQDENFEIFINLVQELKRDRNSYCLVNLILRSDKNILKKHSQELAELMNQSKEHIDIVVAEKIWKILDERYQKQQIGTLRYIMNELQDQGANIFRVWKSTKAEVQAEILDEVLNKCDNPQKKIIFLED